MKQRVVKELIGWKKTMNGRVPIYISSGIGNRNIILYGIPGTGKTRRLIKLALNRVKNGEQVIWFGFHGSNDFDLMPETIKKEYDAVATKRKCFPVLALPWSHNNQPLDADDAAEIAHDLSVAFNLAKTREAAVCDALEEFVEDGRLEKTGLDELIRKLETYETGAAKAAAADMKRYLSEIHVRDGGLYFSKSLLEMDFSGAGFDAQIIGTTLMLEAIFRQAERDAFKEKGLTIVLDEVQDIPFGEGTAFNNLLRIARKKNVSLLMATAVSPLEKKCAPAVARQYCAVSAYFKLADSECRTLARDIDYQHWPKLNSTMHELVKGEFIATGDFVGENDEPERSPQTLCNSEEGEETICITESKSAS